MHYLDNSATTPLCQAAKEAMMAAMESNFGNPSSLHTIGVNAESAVEHAREQIISAMGFKARSGQLVFTSGGTEAANLALIGTAIAKSRNKGKKIIIGEAEHDCVLKSAELLEELGFKVIRIPSPLGVWDMKAYEKALSKDVILISAMLVNNETGAVNDINKIADLARLASPDVIIHTDAVQGFLKLKAPLSSLDADIITVSGHKIGASKGVGALYMNDRIVKTKAISPILLGGGQENGYRSGTENTIGIIGFGAAAEYGAKELCNNLELFSKLRTALGSKLLGIDGVHINVPATSEIAKHIINITVSGIKSETLLHHLSSYEVYVSSGSACSSNRKQQSHVLRSFGLDEKDLDSSIRISLGTQNTIEDIDAFISALEDGISRLARMKR